jgi:hypothetical protein
MKTEKFLFLMAKLMPKRSAVPKRLQALVTEAPISTRTFGTKPTTAGGAARQSTASVFFIEQQVKSFYQALKEAELKEDGSSIRRASQNIIKAILAFEENHGELSEYLKKRLSEALTYEAIFISPIETKLLIELYEKALKYDPSNETAIRKLRAIKVARGMIPVEVIYPEDVHPGLK